MDGSSALGGGSRPLAAGYVVDNGSAGVDGWNNNNNNNINNNHHHHQHHHHHQQLLLQEQPPYRSQPVAVKAEQLSGEPAYDSYVAVTAAPPDLDIKPDLLAPAPQADLTEMQRLSQEYRPDVTVRRPMSLHHSSLFPLRTRRKHGKRRTS